MKFFHVYNEDCIKGLEKNGLINKDTGFKIQHAFSVPKDRLFNNYAKVGGTLHSILKENNMPFYVDRIAGGITYFPYKFDKDLIRVYRDMLGDEFLGFQMHESASNRRDSEWVTFMNVMGSKGPYDVEKMKEKLLSGHAVTPNGERMYDTAHDTVEYFANRSYAETVADFVEEVREMFQRRMDDTDDNILPVDSFYLFTKLQDEMGMRTFMPEVGWQISREREQVALARGVAKSSGKKWGTYYECWRADYNDNLDVTATCMPCYNVHPINEWYLTQETHVDDFTTHGINGGSSRLLQNRIYYHSLMSGADYLSEEWGLNCSYNDMNEWTLSPYGQVKKDFINTALDLQGVQAKIPFAIVLPKDYYCLEIQNPVRVKEYGIRNNVFMLCKLTPAEIEYYTHIEDLLTLFFERKGEAYGTEGHSMTNSRFGDIVDVIYEDAPDAVLSSYEYLIDATKAGNFAAARANSGLKILESKDLEKLAYQMDQLIPQVMPVWVDDLHWLVSTDDKGRRFLTIFNNEGNTRTTEFGDVIDSKATRTVTISSREPLNLSIFKDARENVQLTKIDNCNYRATISGADFIILEY